MAEQLNIESQEKTSLSPEQGADINSAWEKGKEAPSLKVEKPEKDGKITKPILPSDNIVSSTNTSSERKEREEAIDRILADGLEDIFIALPPSAQKKFKEDGEETVRKINKLLEGAKVKVNKIVKLIRRWLSSLPGVNKFFLEQEAKLKADQIIKLKK